MAHAVLLTHGSDDPARRRQRLDALRELASDKAGKADPAEQVKLELLVQEYGLAGAMDMGGPARRPPQIRHAGPKGGPAQLGGGPGGSSAGGPGQAGGPGPGGPGPGQPGPGAPGEERRPRSRRGRSRERQPGEAGGRRGHEARAEGAPGTAPPAPDAAADPVTTAPSATEPGGAPGAGAAPAPTAPPAPPTPAPAAPPAPPTPAPVASPAPASAGACPCTALACRAGACPGSGGSRRGAVRPGPPRRRQPGCPPVLGSGRLNCCTRTGESSLARCGSLPVPTRYMAPGPTSVATSDTPPRGDLTGRHTTAAPGDRGGCRASRGERQAGAA